MSSKKSRLDCSCALLIIKILTLLFRAVMMRASILFKVDNETAVDLAQSWNGVRL